MSLVKHHLLLFDKTLCEDRNFFSVISERFKSTLLLADHFNSSHNQPTIGICSVEFKEKDTINIQPVLLPIVPAASILKEIIASIGTLAPKEDAKNDLLKEIETDLTVEWKEFAASLLPHIVYPPQEGFRVSLISKKSIELKGFVQQPNCLVFQNVKADDIKLGNDTIFNGPLKVSNPYLGLEILKIPPLNSEWDAFFKNFVFDNILSQITRVVIHFSTSGNIHKLRTTYSLTYLSIWVITIK